MSASGEYTTISATRPITLSFFEDAYSVEVFRSKEFSSFGQLRQFFERWPLAEFEEKRDVPMFATGFTPEGRPKRRTKQTMAGPLLVILDVDRAHQPMDRTLETLGRAGVAAWGYTTFSHGDDAADRSRYRVLTDFLAPDWWSLEQIVRQVYALTGLPDDVCDPAPFRVPCFYMPAVHPDRKAEFDTIGNGVSTSVWEPEWIERPPEPERAPRDAVPLENREEVEDALGMIDNHPRDAWVEVGMALHSTRSEDAFEVFVEWSASQDYPDFSVEACERVWESFSEAVGGVTLATIFHRAKEAGWKPQRPSPEPAAEDFASYLPVPSEKGSVASWSPSRPSFDCGKGGTVLQTRQNARKAIRALDLGLRWDEFANRGLMLGQGHAWLQNHFPNLPRRLGSDVSLAVSDVILQLFDVHIGKDTVREILRTFALRDRFNPVAEWLDSLEWDGVPRVATWLTDFAKAPATPYVSEVGRLILVAACARARVPGIKFDMMPILEGPQGCGKSTLIRILGGEYTLESLPHIGTSTANERDIIALMRGKWFIEMAELVGLRKAEVEAMKSFLARVEDSARLAYAEEPEDFPRRSIFIGTTNEGEYLKDDSGNRRFLPLQVGMIDLGGLRDHRDQLFAEADSLWRSDPHEKTIEFAPALRKAAKVEQESRLEGDAWVEAIETWLVAHPEVDRAQGLEILEDALGMLPSRVRSADSRRLASAMKRLGWNRQSIRIDGRVVKGYARPPGWLEERGAEEESAAS